MGSLYSRLTKNRYHVTVEEEDAFYTDYLDAYKKIKQTTIERDILEEGMWPIKYTQPRRPLCDRPVITYIR